MKCIVIRDHNNHESTITLEDVRVFFPSVERNSDEKEVPVVTLITPYATFVCAKPTYAEWKKLKGVK